MMPSPVKVFFSYSHKDEDLRDELEKHLSILQRQGVIDSWHDRKIGAGTEWANAIDDNLNAAEIILLLISADFLASDYCWDVETQRALERHEAGEACVIPIILKPVMWESAPFGKLQAFPKDAKPVTSWSDPNEAFVNIASGIAAAAAKLSKEAPSGAGKDTIQSQTVTGEEILTPPKIAPNPFGVAGKITDPALFFGRDELMRQIFEELGKGVNISLVGAGGVGKSSILQQICVQGPVHFREAQEVQDREFVYLNLQEVDDEEDFYYALCETLKVQLSKGFKLSRSLKNSGKRYVLCLDEIEKMVWDEAIGQRCRSQLRGLADGSETPLKLVIVSRSPLAQLFPDSPQLDSPLAGICRQLDVGAFEEEAAKSFLAQRLAETGVTFTEPEMVRLWVKSQGHPAKLQRVAADLYDQRVWEAG